MKNVVISADGERKVYSVPDIVADNLREYCVEFCDDWLITSPNANKYRQKGWYNEEDFIEYLNEWIFPEEQSVFVENLGWIDLGKVLPKPYNNCPEFNF